MAYRVRENYIRFKTARIYTEWTCLKWQLRALLWGLAEWAHAELKKDTLITCLNRTSVENQKVGGNPNSLHLRDMAADIRIWDWSNSDILKAKQFWDNQLRTDTRFQFVPEKDHIHVEMDDRIKTVELVD